MLVKSTVTFLVLLYTVSLNNAKVTQSWEQTDKFQFQPREHDPHSLNLIANSKEISASSLNKKMPNEFTSSLFKSLSPRATSFKLNGTVDDLTVQFGADSSMWLVVGYKEGEAKKKVFRSDDNGLTYKRYTVFEDYSNKVEIDSVFVNPKEKEFVIFSDLKNRVLFVSQKNGRGWRESMIGFTADDFFFTDDSSVIMSFDQSNRQLWITINSGKSWKLIGENLVQFQPETIFSMDKQQYIYFMEKTEQGYTQLIRFDLTEFKYDQLMQNVQDRKHVVKKAIARYFSIGSSVFIVSKSIDTGSSSLMVSDANGNQFSPVSFEVANREAKQVIGFEAVQLSGADKFIVMTYRMNNIIHNDLYKSSDSSATRFKLSLENIVNKCQSFDSIQAQSCFDIRELNEAGYVFIANAWNDEGIIETFIKYNPYSSNWEPSYYSSEESGLSVNLDKDFFQVHSEPKSSFSPANLPDLMFSRVSQKGVYASQEQGEDWTKILNDSFTYSVAFSEEYRLTVVVAAESDRPTNKLRYSFDYGNNWNEWYFSDSLLMVDEIRRDPVADTPAFLLVCTGDESANLMIKLEFSADYVRVVEEEEPSPIMDSTTTLEADEPTTTVSTSVLPETTKLPGELEVRAEHLTSFNEESYEEAKSLIELSRMHLMILSQYMVPIFIFVSSFLIALLFYLNKKSLKHVSKSTSSILVESFKSARSKPIFRRPLSDQEKLIKIEEDMMV